MIVFTYTAKRALIDGHNIDQVYELELKLSKHIPVDHVDAVQNFTSDDADTIVERDWVEHEFSTNMLNYSEMLACREFLNSVNRSETFTFDFGATIGDPVSPANGIKLLQKSIEPERVSPLKYRYSFVVREFI